MEHRWEFLVHGYDPYNRQVFRGFALDDKAKSNWFISPKCPLTKWTHIAFLVEFLRCVGVENVDRIRDDTDKKMQFINGSLETF